MLPTHYATNRIIKEIKSFWIKNLVTFSNMIQKPSNLFWMVQNYQIFVPNIFFYQICQKFVDLFTKNMKGWSHKKIILYLFCSFDLLRKKVENNFFIRAAVLCANISQIFFLNLINKNICAVYLRVCSSGPLTFFTSFSKPAGTSTE